MDQTNIQLKDQGKTTKEGEKGKDGVTGELRMKVGKRGNYVVGGGGGLKLDCENRVEI